MSIDYFKEISYYIIPKFWKNRFNRISLEGTMIGDIYIEWWGFKKNLGDWLTLPVTQYMLSRKGLSNEIVKGGGKHRHLFVMGSIIGFKGFDATIWGTACLNLEQAYNIGRQSVFREYDIRAVRGPLTQKVLQAAGYNVPDVFGDPGILLPLFYSPSSRDKKYDISVVFHFRYARELQGFHTISIETNDYSFFIDELAASKRVISSSLHGIILAESYGVPAILLCENETEDLFKYYDYYYSTKRYNVKIARTIEEATIMDPMPLPQNLDELRQGLIDTFPYDLWSKGE